MTSARRQRRAEKKKVSTPPITKVPQSPISAPPFGATSAVSTSGVSGAGGGAGMGAPPRHPRGQRVPGETRHRGEPTRDGPRRRRQPEHAAWEPEREIAALPVDGAGDNRHLGPEPVAAPPRNRLGAARGHVP